VSIVALVCIDVVSMRVVVGFTIARSKHKTPYLLRRVAQQMHGALHPLLHPHYILITSSLHPLSHPLSAELSGDVRVFSEERHVSEELRN